MAMWSSQAVVRLHCLCSNALISVAHCVGSTDPLVHQHRKLDDRGFSFSRHPATRIWHGIDCADRHRLGQRNAGARRQTIDSASHGPHVGNFLARDQRFDAATGSGSCAGIFHRRILVGFFRRDRAKHREQHSQFIDPLSSSDLSINDRRQKNTRRLIVKPQAHECHWLLDTQSIL